MGSTVAIEFITLDGVIEDPDGSGGMPWGGWAFRHGPEAVAGDKFDLGPMLETGVMLLGRTTWELFATLWPTRSDPFAVRLNAIPKLVATRTLTAVDRWSNSSLMGDDLIPTIQARTREQDVIITGSIGVVHTLAAHDLIDEYRLMVLPTVTGVGRRLFTMPTELTLDSVERKGAGALLRYRRRA